MYKYLLACVPMHHIHVWCPQRLEQGGRTPGTGIICIVCLIGSKKGIESSRTGIIDGYELPCRHWGSKPGPQKKSQYP